jgi:hypothetical protein
MSTDSNTKTAPEEGTDPTAAIANFWLQWMEQSSRGTQALLEAVQSVSDPNQFQKRWTDVMSETADNFMRTPAFMEMMRRNLKALTDLKVMQDQVVKGTARQLGMPLADDITGLFERLDSTEQKILSRLRAIEDRLEAIEANGRKQASQPQHEESYRT